MDSFSDIRMLIEKDISDILTEFGGRNQTAELKKVVLAMHKCERPKYNRWFD